MVMPNDARSSEGYKKSFIVPYVIIQSDLRRSQQEMGSLTPLQYLLTLHETVASLYNYMWLMVLQTIDKINECHNFFQLVNVFSMSFVPIYFYLHTHTYKP